ncbi:MAG: S8 family serine peptidase, partial [Candidatus Omnitrophica bacterium]|nr:S8 family serine peptidase [Candidatus Omnitrophota bacterium]
MKKKLAHRKSIDHGLRVILAVFFSLSQVVTPAIGHAESTNVPIHTSDPSHQIVPVVDPLAVPQNANEDITNSEDSIRFLAGDSPLSRPETINPTESFVSTLPIFESPVVSIQPVLRSPDTEVGDGVFAAFDLSGQSNDPYFDSSGTWGQSYDDLWWLKRVRAPEAWDFARGDGVTVAVIDSGLDMNHLDIAQNVFQNELEFLGLPDVDDDGNGYIDDIHGWDFISDDNDPTDGNGHGTHVAGIIGAVADNLYGIAGIAPKASILPIRLFNDSGEYRFSVSEFVTDFVDSVHYAVDLGAKVINMSFGGWMFEFSSSQLETLQGAIDYALNLGTVIVAAAGNASSDVQYFMPAGMDNLFAVGATRPVTDARASFSNYGTKLAFMAPGVDVLSLISDACLLCISSPQYLVGNDFMRMSGTSMASPVVAGVVALLKSFDPLLNFSDILRRLQFSAVDLGALGKDLFYGYGLVDAFTAISTDYYATGEIKTRWLAQPDAEGVVRFDFDLLGRVTRKTFEDESTVTIEYWEDTATKKKEIFYRSDGTIDHVIDYDINGNPIDTIPPTGFVLINTGADYTN